MISGSLARRYAKAIFEIGVAQGILDKLGMDIRPRCRLRAAACREAGDPALDARTPK